MYKKVKPSLAMAVLASMAKTKSLWNGQVISSDHERRMTHSLDFAHPAAVPLPCEPLQLDSKVQHDVHSYHSYIFTI